MRVVLLIAVVLLLLANARAARQVGERFGVDAAVGVPHLALVLAIDVVILVVVGIVSSGWAVLALVPVVATVVLVALRSADRAT